MLASAGQPDRSIEQNELAIRINPDDPSIFFRYFGLALAHYLAARYDKALAHANAAVQISPAWWLGLLVSAASLGQMERVSEAKRVHEDLMDTPGPIRDLARDAAVCQRDRPRAPA